MQAHASAACAQARLTSRGAVLVQQHADAPRFGRGGSSAPQRATYTSSWGVAPRGGVRHTSRRVGVHCTADAQSSAVAESPAPAPREVAGHTRNGNGAAAPASRLQRVRVCALEVWFP